MTNLHPFASSKYTEQNEAPSCVMNNAQEMGLLLPLEGHTPCVLAPWLRPRLGLESSAVFSCGVQSLWFSSRKLLPTWVLGLCCTSSIDLVLDCSLQPHLAHVDHG
jgi:hypothetical protein